MLQSKNRTRKLRRQELSQYRRLVKLLDTNLGAVVQQGLVWKRRYEEAKARSDGFERRIDRERRSGLLVPEEKGLIILP